MEKGLFARELWKRAFAMCQIDAWIRELLNAVATPGSELHECLREIAEHKKLGGSKINVSSMYSITSENKSMMLDKLEEFGIIVKYNTPEDEESGFEPEIDLMQFKVIGEEEPIFFRELGLDFNDIAHDFKKSDAG